MNKKQEIIKIAIATADINNAGIEMTSEQAKEKAHKIFLSLVDNISIDILDELDYRD